jgi:hypothetical protein
MRQELRKFIELEMGVIKPCIGCGFCCVQAMCVAGRYLHPELDDQVVCPELHWNGQRHVCLLMEQPGIAGERYRQGLYAGEGCCSNLNSWRREPLKNRCETKEGKRWQS